MENFTNLIWCVAYANVKVREVGLDEIANGDIQFPLLRSILRMSKYTREVSYTYVP
jgi:hypothetical protein